ncbi:MAG: hypothetical protein HOG03_16485 [Desulfobacula sp.]|jgi:hypothetical protein|uniref:hypothetical protein n=1 Tax=Desulfobacula sp. TaxID=2593537 RepID=UPI001DCB2AA6|nr:hypothetical protein [Desulfobacula sp.]MBT3484328.1 hypothetical protein [Desulfobacula sp.]MBT3806177.1 hypothetical protein [Desulfobacula sp.]MBT4024137.1 hypothetical protein [Desulfobacula sp.]MBT4197461.1 hypothetical protein [Desulfobacula sp.]
MDNKKADLIYFAMVIFVLVALPFGISSYDQNIWNDKIPKDAKVFDLTGQAPDYFFYCR